MSGRRQPGASFRVLIMSRVAAFTISRSELQSEAQKLGTACQDQHDQSRRVDRQTRTRASIHLAFLGNVIHQVAGQARIAPK